METNKEKSGVCFGFSAKAHSASVRIYNLIRAVGRSEITADNALHQLVEDYHDLRELGIALHDFALTLREEASHGA